MRSDNLPGAEALLAERARLENLLSVSEDWRALQQLRARAARGEGISAINATNLEAMLVNALTDNPFFGPYKSVCLAIDQLAEKSGAANGATSKGATDQTPGADDLTRIRGVDASLAKRLRDLGVTTFAEIADWRAADIQHIAKELDLGKQIHSQNWIEQAALYALTSPNKAPAKQPPPTKPPADVKAAAGETLGGKDVVGAVASVATVAPSGADELAIDPNQLTLDFSRKPAAPKSEQVKISELTGSAEAKAGQAPATPGKAANALQPVQKPAAASATPSVSAAPANTTQIPAPEVKPVGPAPRPLVAQHYGLTAAAEMPSAAVPASSSPSGPAAVATSPSKATSAPAPSLQTNIGPPPRPLVVTRASLPARPTDNASDAKPLLGSSALKPVANASDGTPSMSIDEAIAYAAELARQGSKVEDAKLGGDGKGVPAAVKASPPAPAAPAGQPASVATNKAPASEPSASTPSASKPAPPPIPHTIAAKDATPAKPAVVAGKTVTPPLVVTPPPLPEAFKAPPPPAPEPQRAQPRATRIEHARSVEREDFSNRSNVEEASVEIVRRQVNGAPPVMDAAVAAALAATNAQIKARPNSAEAETDRSAPRGATPIGRFLKALTGN